jgi:hypothetical protein
MASRKRRRRKGASTVTRAQEAHLARVKKKFVLLVDAKYRAGAAEHGGELLALPDLIILDFAIDEAIDQIVYLLSLRERLSRRKR